MANYSIMTMAGEVKDNKVEGYWVQDCAGCTLEQAQERLNSYHKAGGHHSRYFLTNAVTTTQPALHGKFLPCEILALPNVD